MQELPEGTLPPIEAPVAPQLDRDSSEIVDDTTGGSPRESVRTAQYSVPPSESVASQFLASRAAGIQLWRESITSVSDALRQRHKLYSVKQLFGGAGFLYISPDDLRHIKHVAEGTYAG